MKNLKSKVIFLLIPFLLILLLPTSTASGQVYSQVNTTGDTTLVIPKGLGVHHRNLFYNFIPIIQRRSITQDSVISAQGAEIAVLRATLYTIQESYDVSQERIVILSDINDTTSMAYENQRKAFRRERAIKDRWRGIAIVTTVLSTTFFLTR